MFLHWVKFLFVASLLLISNALIAQGDTSSVRSDSIRNVFLQDQARQLKELENQRRNDSLERIDLEGQLIKLKSTDNLKKQELLQQLEDLKSVDSIRTAKQSQKIDSLKQFVTGFPVVPFLDDTLFVVYSKLGSFSPQDRAEAISRRINDLVDDYFFKPDSLKFELYESSVDINYGDKTITSITDLDALWMDMNKGQLAEVYRKKIIESVTSYKHMISWKTLSKEILLALLVIAILLTIIISIRKLFRWIRFRIISQRGKKFKGIKIKSYQLFDANSEVTFFIAVSDIVKWIAIIVSIYLALPILFGIFPWTQGYSGTMLNYFLDPLKSITSGIWEYIPNLITIAVIVFVFRLVLKGLNFLKEEVEEEKLSINGFFPDWANPTYQIIRILVLAFMLIVIFPYMPGSDSAVFKGVSVFLGVLFTFGSAGALSNVVAGLILTYMRAFKVADRVKIGDVTGDIIEKSLLVTRIRTIKNEIISIPNSTVMSSHTINYSSDASIRGLIMHTTVTIGYDVPWRQVHQLLLDAAKATDDIQNDPAPFVLQTSLDDFYVSYQLNAYTSQPQSQAVIYSNLHQQIQDKFNEAGVEIMSPHYKALRDGNTSTIPGENLPEDYVAPGFKMEKEK